MSRPTRIVIVIGSVLVILMGAGLTLVWRNMDLVHWLPLRVSGQLVSASDGKPIPGAWVIAIPDRAWAQDKKELARVTAWARKWEALQQSEGTLRPRPGSAPAHAGGATTRVDGSFDAHLLMVWSSIGAGPFQRGDDPTPHDGIKCLRIEMEGRDPVILDVPTGTSTYSWRRAMRTLRVTPSSMSTVPTH